MTGVAVVGAAETTQLGKIPDLSQIQLHADAALNAMADAGLCAKDIDGIATAGSRPTDLAHYLGITLPCFENLDSVKNTWLNLEALCATELVSLSHDSKSHVLCLVEYLEMRLNRSNRNSNVLAPSPPKTIGSS